MTKDQLYHELNYVNATHVCRAKYADLILNNTGLIHSLLEILFSGDKKISPRASWIFEFVIKEDYRLIFPYLDFFTENISTLDIDSATRPCAKIIEILIDLYYKKEDKDVLNHLTKTHRERIIEASFAWLLREEKVAIKAYSMNSLYLLGTEFDWIHPELKTILERDYTTQSAGFKARSRHILKRLERDARS
ncbi:adenylosuccinate lyase [Winogradskyella sp.]|uniref:adenylosuccinate lyase n=1 Tax=Winogradskyella sp. TaxID=1883156 RepID=UPI0025E418FE|nr:adenylosuccinate lyase [Winogradskyella sp.]MBT8243949.1 adenylosuccinate lyase [Winogradskyella sp.]